MISIRKYYFTTIFIFTTEIFCQIPLPSFRLPDHSISEIESHHVSTVVGQPFYTSASSPWYDVTYYKLQLTIETFPAYLQGHITIIGNATAADAGPLILDLRKTLKIDSLFVNDTVASFTQDTASFAVSLPRGANLNESIILDIYYHGVPAETGFGSFVFGSHADIPWVWSLSEPAGARDWWPCKDDPSDKADSADIFVTCDSSLKVGSQGSLESVINVGNGRSTTHWHESYPIAAYLISIAVTNFKEYTNYFKYSDTDSMQIINYLLPEHYDAVVPLLQRVPDMLAIYSKLFGMYPFIKEKYGHAEFGKGGAMEHQTMTSTTTFEENTVSHELGHQWFGDMITCRTWSDLWLNEGFAQYCSALYLENEYGESFYQRFVNEGMNAALQATGSIGVADTTSVRNLFDYNRVYQKGCIVLHMLRHVLGDSMFFQAMKSYAQDPALQYNTATIADFQSVVETESRRDLSWFFNEWIYGTGYPEYLFSWSDSSETDGYKITITIAQNARSNPVYFTMPIDLQIVGNGWDTTVTVFNNALQQQFVFTISHLPVKVQLDPDSWILQRAFDNSAFPPESFQLEQNYPNPFNSETTISYSIPRRSKVSLRIFDLLGRQIEQLVDENAFPGKYSVRWNASAFASGLYFYRVSADSFTKTRKMILLK